MKHIVIILLSLWCFLSAASQSDVPKPNPYPKVKVERPDMAQIRREVSDRNSPYYYPRLMEEYLRNDSVMKLDKFRRLYLGYMFQEDYDPYRMPYPVAAHVQELYGKKNLTKAECDSIIKNAQLSLANNPLDFMQIQAMINALRSRGNVNLAELWEYKLRYLLMAIVSTGTGRDEDNAWYIVETHHEYILLNQMGLKVRNHLFYEPSYEYITVEDANGNETGGYYFNIGPLLREYYRKHPDELDE